MRRYRRPYDTAAQRVLRRAQTQLDNIALVPASELNNLGHWEQASRSLPPGDVLVVAGSNNLRLREVERQIDRVLQSRGRRAQLATFSE